MAAATATGRRQNGVSGGRRMVTWDSVSFAASGDTLLVPGIKRLESIDYTPTTNASFGFTIGSPTTAGVTITIVSGGAVAGLFQASGI